MQSARAWVCGALLVASGAARADSYYLESEPLTTRDAAQGVAELAEGVGCPGSVQRRYVGGEGWRYLFRSQVVGSSGAVERCISELGAPEGVVLRVVSRQGRRLRAAVPAPASAPASPALRSEDVLARVVRAHGGGEADLATAPDLLFRFVRRAGGRVVRHTYARRDGDVFLDVEVLDGPGVSSRAGIVDDVPWLAGGEDALLLDAARRHLARFAPEHVLAAAAQLAAGHIDVLGLEGAEVVSSEGTVVVLERAGDRERPTVRARIDTEAWHLEELSRGVPGQEVQWRFEGWQRTDAGLLLPRAVDVRRGDEAVDRVEVEALELEAVLPDAWFPPQEP